MEQCLVYLHGWSTACGYHRHRVGSSRLLILQVHRGNTPVAKLGLTGRIRDRLERIQLQVHLGNSTAVYAVAVD